jgi:diguanylate cyclase (GGDEF)-like protein/PAS domain S-box-containing protein
MQFSRFSFNGYSFLKLLGAIALYTFSSRILLNYFAPADSVSLFFIASGIGLSFILIGGNRYAISILFGSILSNVLGGLPIFTALGMGVGSMLGAVLGAKGLMAQNRFDSTLSSLSDWLRLIVFGGCFGCAISAIVGATSLLLSGFIGTTAYLHILINWWLGDMLGVILITPFILSWWQVRHLAIHRQQLTEPLLMLGLIFLVGQTVFLGWFHYYIGEIANTYWLFLLITWVAVRLETRWVTLVLIITSLQALQGVYAEFGIFSSDFAQSRALNYWFYITVLTVVGMTLSLYITTHQQAENEFLIARYQLQATLDAIPDLLFELGVDGYYYDYHAHRSELLAAPPELFLGKKVEDVLPPAGAKIIMAALQEAQEKGWSTGKQLELQLSGITRWFELSVAVKLTDNPQQPRFIMLSRDITKRKQTEQQMLEGSARITMLMNSVGEGIYGVDMQGNCTFINAAGLSLLGYQDESELLGKHMHNLIHHTYPDGSPYSSQECRLYTCLNSHENVHVDDELFWRKDGSSFPVDYWSRPTLLKGEYGAVVTFIDITERKQTETELRIAATVFEAQEGMLIAGANEVILKVNHAFVAMTGYSEAEILGQTPRLFNSGKHSKAFYAKLWQSILETGVWQGEIWNRRKNGDIFPQWLSITAVKGNNDKIVTHYVATLTDISERKATEEHIHRLAFYDPLTELPNRRLLQERLKHGLEVNRRSGSQMAVLMMDLDKFKAVNDSLGHAAGDELLEQVAKRINNRLREVDLVARLGGDEFVILMENLEHCEYVARVAEDIIQILTQPFTLSDNHTVEIGASIGIAIHPQHGDSVELLMDHADTALYHAKYQGRGCFAYFSEDLTHKARERLALESRLRRAISEQELRVYFQPQVEISSGTIIGAEALVRWHDPVYGLMMPNDFIPIAEETGLIIPMGEWVLRETCRLGQEWLNAGLSAITLAVNVSPHQFRRSDINALVTQVLEESGFSAEFLELEITESGLMENQEHAMAILQQLHLQGVRLAIDDFGTGYSSLAYLKYFPLDVLKIDKTFIDDIPFLQGDMAITSTIISMAHHLGFKVLAEGVETAAQLAFLREQGCDMYQGYFYSKPVCAAEFETLLRNSQNQLK